VPGDIICSGPRPIEQNNRPGLGDATATQSEPATRSTMKTWICLICGHIYDEAAGDPEHGVPPGTRWEDVPEDWSCPDCGAAKSDYEMVQL
jgi:rubredoxin